MPRLTVPITPKTQAELRGLIARTGSHTRTVQQAVDVLALVDKHTNVGRVLISSDGRQLYPTPADQ